MFPCYLDVVDEEHKYARHVTSAMTNIAVKTSSHAALGERCTLRKLRRPTRRILTSIMHI